MLHVFETIGTEVSLEIPGYKKAPALTATVESIFETTASRFSLLREDSELSLVASGELELANSSVALRNAYASAQDWHKRTGGAFSPNRPDGTIDLDGLVRARAMDAAGHAVESAGIGNWCLNVGGDILCRGTEWNGWPWRLGIADPVDRSGLLGTVTLEGGRRAVATSGGSEHGAHIWFGGDAHSAEFLQVTVSADDIITANVLATSIMSGGQASVDRFIQDWPIDVMTVDLVGDLRTTPGFRASLAA
jgi:FAD:protein FMN transferase